MGSITAVYGEKCIWLTILHFGFQCNVIELINHVYSTSQQSNCSNSVKGYNPQHYLLGSTKQAWLDSFSTKS